MAMENHGKIKNCESGGWGGRRADVGKERRMEENDKSSSDKAVR